jgi:RNA polymerase sigma-70 factor (ECF subfamily)
LVNRHQAHLYQLCLALLRDPHEAEEAAQVALIKAYQALGSFRGGSTFRTWLTRIALNHCKDVLRQKRRWKTYPLEGFAGEGRSTPEALVQRPPASGTQEAGFNPDQVVSLSEGEKRILRLLQEKEGLSYGEMGRELGLTLDGVKGRLKRARAKINAFLRESFSDGN